MVTTSQNLHWVADHDFFGMMHAFFQLNRPVIENAGMILPFLTLKSLQSQVDVNGQTYDVSYTKKNLIQNAVRKGVKESVIETMLDDAAIVPRSSSSRVSLQI